jgi:hypothetical protein
MNNDDRQTALANLTSLFRENSIQKKAGASIAALKLKTRFI